MRPETITALKIMTPAEIPPQPPVPHTDEARHRAKFAKEMINPGLGINSSFISLTFLCMFPITNFILFKAMVAVQLSHSQDLDTKINP